MNSSNYIFVAQSLLEDLPTNFMDRDPMTNQIHMQNSIEEVNEEIARSWAFLFGTYGNNSRNAVVHDGYSPTKGIPDELQSYLKGLHIGQHYGKIGDYTGVHGRHGMGLGKPTIKLY
jgi:hypothetical protein